MRYLLIYHRRLGDIVGSLAAARYLATQGHEIWMETDAAYADIFNCVDYCRWKDPAAAGDFDVVIRMQIHTPELDGGHRLQQFRRSGRHWFEFAYNHPDIAAARWQRPVFTRTDWFDSADYNLPADRNYALICAAGITQNQAHSARSVLKLARSLYGDVPLVQLSPSPTTEPGFIYVKRLREFPGLIAHPRYFLSINSGPAWIAAGARSSYHHIPQVGRFAQDDSSFPGVSIKVLPLSWRLRLLVRRWRYHLTRPSTWFAK